MNGLGAIVNSFLTSQNVFAPSLREYMTGRPGSGISAGSVKKIGMKNHSTEPRHSRVPKLIEGNPSYGQ